MKLPRFLACALLCLACLLPAAAQPLAARLQTLVEQSPLLQTSEVGATVYDLTAGQPVYAYQSRKLYRPASIEKVITCVAALARLGADYPLCTRLYYTGTVQDSTLRGNLYVKGGFDTLFGEEDLQTLVRGVQRLGIRRVEGTLYADVSLKDSLRFGQGWSWDDAPFEFQPWLSPLTYNRGCVRVTCTPGAPGAAPAVEVVPASGFYSLDNRAVSRTPAAGKLRIDRAWMDHTNEIVLRGNVSRRTSETLPLSYPHYFFLHLLAERLQRHGIQTADYAQGHVPAEAKELAVVSRPLRKIMDEALKESDNLAAEAIFYTLGKQQSGARPAQAKDGIGQIEALIRELGHQPDRYNIADGSGVSLYNYISPELMLAFLRYAHTHETLFAPFYEALPIAGVDGTLAHRLRKTPAFRQVRAKTGTVKGVSSLAGYARAANGHLLAFVIINQNALKASQARALQDKFCIELCK